MRSNDDVRVLVEGACGIIELDRPKALNSLNLGMIKTIQRALDTFASDDSILLVIIASTEERAFCAGGDVRSVRETDLAGDFSAGDEFFAEEYALNLDMARYNKPIIAMLEGVVMGGGFGISAHGSHRIVTERTLGAMPEMAIGFVPDVGMSHVLTHLSVGPELGTFIGMTGWRLHAADMLYTGLATHAVPDYQTLRLELVRTPLWEALPAVAHPAEEYAQRFGESVLLRERDRIIAACSHPTWVEVEQEMRSWVEQDPTDEFALAVKEQLDTANPESLVAGFALFRRAQHVDLATALRMEKAVGDALRRRPNFAEGVRAVLVDKDRKPAFQPATATEVDAQYWEDLLDDVQGS